jgi:hypothetical protein
MLTTMVFILAAYLIYDYFAARSKQRIKYYYAKKYSIWKTLATHSLLGLLLFCVIVIFLADHKENQRIEGFRGTLWAGTQPDKLDNSFDNLKINGRRLESNSAYAFLNPGVPSYLIKPSKLIRRRKPSHLNDAIRHKKR